MIEVNEQLAEVISNSRVAFINGQMAEAFKLAKEAIKLDENCADAYQCAANVCMSLSRYEDAIEYYQKAVNCDPNNGNRYFSLGYAQASVNKIAEAMQNFAKADELGLNEDAAGQMYHILGIVNQEFGKLDDALINLKKSELIIPADMDILKRKAVIYGLLDEITNGLQTANQWIKNNIGKIVDDPDDIIEGLATGDTVKELFRVNVSNDKGLVNVTTSVKSLK